MAEDEGTVQVCAALVIVITDASSEFAFIEFAIAVNLATHNGTGIVIRTLSELIRLVISLECFIEITPDFLCPFMND